MIIIRSSIVLFMRKRTSIYSSYSIITEQRKCYIWKKQRLSTHNNNFDRLWRELFPYVHHLYIYIYIFSFLDVKNDKCTVLSFFFRRRRWRKRDFTFFVLYFAFWMHTHLCCITSHTYALLLACSSSSINSRHREKKEDEGEEEEEEYSPFSLFV